MISAILVIYALLWFRSKCKIGKIENPSTTTGVVSGCEIVANKKKKWVRDIVSFNVDKDVFMATNSSSPFYLSGEFPVGKKFKVVYNKLNPNDNIIVDNTVFEQLKISLFVMMAVYAICLIALIFWI